MVLSTMPKLYVVRKIVTTLSSLKSTYSGAGEFITGCSRTAAKFVLFVTELQFIILNVI